MKHLPLSARCPKFALVAVLAVSVSGSSLLAAPDNLGTQQSGAVVAYSTPLKGGANPNSLVSGKSNTKLSFANQGKSHLIVIDLGKPSKLNSVGLKFSNPSKLNVFVLKKKPEGNDWNKAIEGLNPDGVMSSSGVPAPLDGAEGQYLVLVAPNNPGSFSDFFVTGIHLDGPNDHQIAFNHNHGDDGNTLAEVPLPSSAYSNHNQPPPSHVPPVSTQSH